MTLDPDWSLILRRAWSVRLIALACLLTGAEAIALVFGVSWLPLPEVWRALLLFGVSAGALVARIMAQRGVP